MVPPLKGGMNVYESIETLMRGGRWRDAQVACEDLLYFRPTDAKLHAFEGICFFRLGNYAAAEPCFMRATALDPSFVDAGVKRCQCLERMKRFDDAVYYAREWQAKRPADPALGVILHNHGNRPDAYRTDAWEKNLRPTRAIEYARSA